MTTPWPDALQAAALLAVDPAGCGGVLLRAGAHAARERWLSVLRELLPEGTVVRRVPAGIGDERLLGGLDLAATLHAGRPVARAGVLAESDGGVLLLAMAERLPAGTAARIGAALDDGRVEVQRDGLALTLPARIGVVALDEGEGDDEHAPRSLTERLGLWLELAPDAAGHSAFGAGATQGGRPNLGAPYAAAAVPDPAGRGTRHADGLSRAPARVGARPVDAAAALPDAQAVLAARSRLPRVEVADETLVALCEAAALLGVASARASLQALRVARAAAALAGRLQPDASDAALAARLVLAPRATRWPQAPAEPEADAEPPQPPPPDEGGEADTPTEPGAPLDRPLADRLLEAAASVLPPDLLARLKLGAPARGGASAGGRGAPMQRSRWRGRPIGSRPGELRGGARLDLLDTLRAAAPWQPLRRRVQPQGASRRAVLVQKDDFRIRRFRQRSETTTAFVVDASGSAAMHRLAEAKGAVELLLAECYVRRDRVALVAFRGAAAELLLPPTRSLVRAKRALAALPGGGGTPLAAAIDAARRVADGVRAQAGSVLLVFLTDGRANIARDGAPGRERAQTDALAAARALRSTAGTGFGALLIDTSREPQAAARTLGEAMGALYLPLPHADARGIAQAVLAAQAVK